MKTKKLFGAGPVTWTVAVAAMMASLPLGATPEAVPSTPTEIEGAIKMDIEADQEMRGCEVTISMRNGIAVLEGKVSTLNQSERALARALAMMNVRAVLNMIEITPSDSSMKAGAENALKNQRLMDASQIKVSENQGRVLLTGTVGTWDEQELARELISRVPAVGGIDNQLQVSYEGIRTDEQILAQLQHMIADDPLYAGLHLGVRVSEGVVTLQGEVGSKAEMDRLIRRSYVTGVFEVKMEKLTINSDLAMEILTDKHYTPEQTLLTLLEVLAMDPRVESANIKPSLREGVLILAGTVRDLREKEAAEMDARGIPGVGAISNELVVRAARDVAKNEKR